MVRVSRSIRRADRGIVHEGGHDNVTAHSYYGDHVVTRPVQARHMDMGEHVQVRILGPIQVIDGDGEVALSPQQRRLLALLAVAQGGYVSADVIAEYIADGDAHGSKLRTAVSRLRKVLGDRVETVSGGYRLKLTEEEFDAARFEALRDQARIAAMTDRAAVISEALGLWRGAALMEVADLMSGSRKY